jgi:hypothetical protein
MSETPSFREAIDAIVEYHLSETNTCMPGIVRAYDATKRRATIQPALNRQFEDDSFEYYPPIVGVPVHMPSGGGFTISLPIAVGDTVTLLFSQRSIEKWKQSTTGNTINPEDFRRFDLTDAIAIPGLHPFSASPNLSLANSDTDLILTAGSSVIRMKPDGTIDMNGATITPAGDVVSATGVSLSNHLHTGNLGAPTGAPIPTP